MQQVSHTVACRPHCSIAHQFVGAPGSSYGSFALVADDSLCLLLGDYEQVLEAVLPRIGDVRTLVVCSIISQECGQQAQHAVKANLPALIQHCRLHQQTDQDKLRQLQWLCSTAGTAAVNTHEAGCKILHLLSGLKSVSTAADALKRTGM